MMSDGVAQKPPADRDQAQPPIDAVASLRRDIALDRVDVLPSPSGVVQRRTDRLDAHAAPAIEGNIALDGMEIAATKVLRGTVTPQCRS